MARKTAALDSESSPPPPSSEELYYEKLGQREKRMQELIDRAVDTYLAWWAGPESRAQKARRRAELQRRIRKAKEIIAKER